MAALWYHCRCIILNGVGMDLVDGMRVFVAAVETGSFAGAAGRVGISPKLASKYMAELEARMGTQLLYRTTRRLGLTAAGQRLMAQAPEWLDQLDEMAAEMRDAQRAHRGVEARRESVGDEVVASSAKMLGDMHALGTHIGLDPNQSTVPE